MCQFDIVLPAITNRKQCSPPAYAAYFSCPIPSCLCPYCTGRDTPKYNDHHQVSPLFYGYYEAEADPDYDGVPCGNKGGNDTDNRLQIAIILPIVICGLVFIIIGILIYYFCFRVGRKPRTGSETSKQGHLRAEQIDPFTDSSNRQPSGSCGYCCVRMPSSTSHTKTDSSSRKEQEVHQQTQEPTTSSNWSTYYNGCRSVCASCCICIVPLPAKDSQASPKTLKMSTATLGPVEQQQKILDRSTVASDEEAALKAPEMLMTAKAAQSSYFNIKEEPSQQNKPSTTSKLTKAEVSKKEQETIPTEELLSSIITSEGKGLGKRENFGGKGLASDTEFPYIHDNMAMTKHRNRSTAFGQLAIGEQPKDPDDVILKPALYEQTGTVKKEPMKLPLTTHGYEMSGKEKGLLEKTLTFQISPEVPLERPSEIVRTAENIENKAQISSNDGRNKISAEPMQTISSRIEALEVEQACEKLKDQTDMSIEESLATEKTAEQIDYPIFVEMEEAKNLNNAEQCRITEAKVQAEITNKVLLFPKEKTAEAALGEAALLVSLMNTALLIPNNSQPQNVEKGVASVAQPAVDVPKDFQNQLNDNDLQRKGAVFHPKVKWRDLSVKIIKMISDRRLAHSAALLTRPTAVIVGHATKILAPKETLSLNERQLPPTIEKSNEGNEILKRDEKLHTPSEQHEITKAGTRVVKKSAVLSSAKQDNTKAAQHSIQADGSLRTDTKSFPLPVKTNVLPTVLPAHKSQPVDSVRIAVRSSTLSANISRKTNDISLSTKALPSASLSTPKALHDTPVLTSVPKKPLDKPDLEEWKKRRWLWKWRTVQKEELKDGKPSISSMNVQSKPNINAILHTRETNLKQVPTVLKKVDLVNQNTNQLPTIPKVNNEATRNSLLVLNRPKTEYKIKSEPLLVKTANEVEPFRLAPLKDIQENDTEPEKSHLRDVTSERKPARLLVGTTDRVPQSIDFVRHRQSHLEPSNKAHREDEMLDSAIRRHKWSQWASSQHIELVSSDNKDAKSNQSSGVITKPLTGVPPSRNASAQLMKLKSVITPKLGSQVVRARSDEVPSSATTRANSPGESEEARRRWRWRWRWKSVRNETSTSVGVHSAVKRLPSSSIDSAFRRRLTSKDPLEVPMGDDSSILNAGEKEALKRKRGSTSKIFKDRPAKEPRRLSMATVSIGADTLNSSSLATSTKTLVHKKSKRHSLANEKLVPPEVAALTGKQSLPLQRVAKANRQLAPQKKKKKTKAKHSRKKRDEANSPKADHALHVSFRFSPSGMQLRQRQKYDLTRKVTEIDNPRHQLFDNY